MIGEIPLIAFFGPDGSGKSTVTDLIEKRLAAKGKVVIRYHWRPRALPSLKKDYSTLSFDSPGKTKPRKYLFSFGCYVYFFFDFWVAQRMFFRKPNHRNSIILYERYFFDILFHPRRYRLTSINWLGSFLSKFVRKPDISFVLIGTPEVIRNRKPELKVAEIKRQIYVMSDRLPNLCKTIIIDTDEIGAMEVSDEVVSIISDIVCGIT